MAIYNYTSSISGTTQHGNYTLGAAIPSEVSVKKRFFDCSTYNLASGSYYKIFNVPANTLVVRAYLFVHTVEGASETCDLCAFLDTDTTPSSVTALCDDVDLNTDDTMSTASQAWANDAASGLYILANAALTAAKFWVVAEYIPLTTTD